MDVNCYDCTKLKEEDELYSVTEGASVKVIRKVCFVCFRQRERAMNEEGNWKRSSKTWIH